MRLVLFLVAALTMAGCNYNKVKVKEDERGKLRFDKSVPPDFKMVFGAVIGPKCATCHSVKGGNADGVNLETYENVRARLNRVLFRSLESPERPMPPRPEILSEDEKDMLVAWDKLGAPEKLSPVDKPGGEASGPANWATIKNKLFAVKCLDCHQPPKPDKDLDLTNLTLVREKAHLIFDRVVIKADMPLEPYPAVTTSERRLLLKWFETGMPE